MSVFNRRTVRKVFDLASRRLSWLVRSPRVHGPLSPMFPGAMRMDEAEEEAAAEAVRQVIRSKKLFRYYGPTLNPFETSRGRELERAFEKYLHVPHALAVNSGTSALVCGLAALGIGPGDEVVVPAYTWVSTASSVVALGAVPVIAEVDDSLTLDPEDVRRRLSPYTRAVIAVHMRGAPAAIDTIAELCRDRGLVLIEDVAQALGGRFHGQSLGTFGTFGAFSFQVSKALTAGEGGMVVTSDKALHLRAAMYHDSAVCPHMGVGLDRWLAGVNLRMSELHAAVLLVQFSRLERIVADMRARKARIKAVIRDRLEALGVTFRTIRDVEGDSATALILFVPEAKRVGPFVAALATDNVPVTRLYYDLAYLPHDHVDLHASAAWTPILQQRSWSRSGEPWRSHPRRISYSADDWPRTMDLLRRSVHIDVSPDLTERQADQIGASIVAAAERLF